MERERVRWGRERRQDFSVFVLNLPRLLDRYGLFGIFQKAGNICDAYIPSRSNGMTRRRFGFVRFTNAEDARRSIQIFHGAKVRGSILYVTKAKPRKRNQQDDQRVQRKYRDQNDYHDHKVQGIGRTLDWRPKSKEAANRGKEVVFIDEDQANGFSLTGEISMENEEWLRRSLVCTVEEPRDLATLSSALLCTMIQMSS